MKTARAKQQLLEHLAKTPIVQVACQKTGISRATYYWWRKKDESFMKATDEALAEGSELVNDMAESQLLTAIREGNLTGIIFWLKHHHQKYSTRVEVDAHHQVTGRLTADEEALVRKALEAASKLQEVTDDAP